jgi:UDP-N-acetylenolpyruvoylglucosamine reductase
MNHKKKAKELIEQCKFISYDLNDIESHKEHAQLIVNEVLKAVSINQILSLTDMTYQIHYDYTKVKKEIENYENNNNTTIRVNT